MILHFNHLSRGKSAASLNDLTGLVAGSLTALAESGAIDPRLLRALRVHLDWIHYKTNFREPVMVRRTTTTAGQPGPLAEVSIDLRQADPLSLPRQLAEAFRAHTTGQDHDSVYLDPFVPWRESIIWKFNRMFWQWLPEWEAASGRGFEQALPSGSSDANHPQAIADSVAEFWRLLRDLDERHQLPEKICALEIGAGSGMRARAWLDGFQALDEQSGTGYYARLKFFLGDYSPATLEARGQGRQRPLGQGLRRADGRAQPVRQSSGDALQDAVRAPHERVRQPAVR